jgi:hypothetical protein
LLFFPLLVCLFPQRAEGQAVAEAGALTSASGASAAKAVIVPLPKVPLNESKSPHLSVTTIQNPEVANRKLLEQKSGKNPGKLLLRSTPSAAQVWINGMFVGSTPLLLIVAPGKYQVELRGARMEHAAKSVDLLPNETRVVSLMLAVRYPTRASVR